MAFTLPRSITVDFSTDVDPQPIKAVQGDQTRVAKITLLNKSVPVNLTGLTVRAYVMPFGETVGLYEDVAVTDATAGKVEYSLSGNACVKAGDGVVNIQVTETATGKQAYTDEIPLKVKARKDFTGAIVGSTVFSALQTAIATALGLDAAAVHKAGEETITGLKSVPTPTAGAHITNKDYVDQNINLVLPTTGIWYPTFAGSTTPGANQYSTRVGRWYKIGKLVHVEFSLTMSAKDSSMAGNLKITDLPFAAAGNPTADIGICSGITMSTTYNNQISGVVSVSSIALYGLSNGSFDNVPCTGIVAGALIQGSVDYMTA